MWKEVAERIWQVPYLVNFAEVGKVVLWTTANGKLVDALLELGEADSPPRGVWNLARRITIVFGELEREPFVRLMREYEAFCGVRILTDCILSHHFHLLVEVPERPVE